MKSFSQLACIVVAAHIAASNVWGQDRAGVPPPSGEQTAADMQAEIAALQKRMETLESQVKAIDLTSQNTANALQGILDQLDKMREDTNRQLDAIAGKLDSATQSDGGLSVPQILGNMAKDPEFRQQMARVIQGKIVVNNETGMEQQIYINGVRWRAPLGESFTHTPYGTVTTHLAPWESPRQWTIQDWRFVDDEYVLRIGIRL